MAWLGTWAKRIAITIDHTKVDADLTDFPVCIHLAAAAGISSDDVSAVFDELTTDSNRKKIAVTTSDGTTQCYVEIEKWDDANEQAFLHVKVPSISSAVDTTLYIYYDSAQSDNTSYVGDTGDAVSQNVWDSNFVAVWHFATIPATSAVYDSTINVNHGNPSSGLDASRLISGKCGGAYNVTSSKYITVPNKTCLRILDNITTEAVFYHVSSTDWQALFNKGYNIPYGMKGSPKVAFRINAGGDYAIGTNYSYGAWVSMSGTYSSSAVLMRVFANGAYYASHANSGLIDDNTNPVIICSDSVYWYFNGYIDELRLSNVVRSDAWIASTHNTLFDTLLTFAVEEGISTAVSVDVPSALCALLSLVPAVNPYHVAGIVQEQGSAVARTVRLYDRSTGALVDSVVSDAGDGSFDFSDIDGKVYTVIAFDADAGSDFNALIYDRVQATQAS